MVEVLSKSGDRGWAYLINSCSRWNLESYREISWVHLFSFVYHLRGIRFGFQFFVQLFAEKVIFLFHIHAYGLFPSSTCFEFYGGWDPSIEQSLVSSVTGLPGHILKGARQTFFLMQFVRSKITSSA